MKILLMGPQGCGKGTQGEKLSEHLGIPLVGVGDLLRDLPESHSHYEEVNKYMQEGELAPSELVAKVIVNRVSQEDCKKGYILDGWARDMGNLGFFDPGFNKVIVFKLSRETSIKRITGRRFCEADGKTYNVNTFSKEELAKCPGELTQREDDTEEAVNVRLNIYYSETVEVIDYLKKQGIVVEIDAEGDPDKVFQDILEALNLP